MLSEMPPTLTDGANANLIILFTFFISLVNITRLKMTQSEFNLIKGAFVKQAEKRHTFLGVGKAAPDDGRLCRPGMRLPRTGCILGQAPSSAAAAAAAFGRRTRIHRLCNLIASADESEKKHFLLQHSPN